MVGLSQALLAQQLLLAVRPIRPRPPPAPRLLSRPLPPAASAASSWPAPPVPPASSASSTPRTPLRPRAGPLSSASSSRHPLPRLGWPLGCHSPSPFPRWLLLARASARLQAHGDHRPVNTPTARQRLPSRCWKTGATGYRGPTEVEQCPADGAGDGARLGSGGLLALGQGLGCVLRIALGPVAAQKKGQ